MEDQEKNDGRTRPARSHTRRSGDLFRRGRVLLDPDDWTEEVAAILAAESGIPVLTEDHWKVFRFFRTYYFYHGRAPMNRHLKEGTMMSLRDIELLFPGGIRLGARRLSGLPNPKTCL